MFELRWKLHDQGPPPRGSIHIKHQLYQCLEYRAMMNPEEIGLQEPIWSEWEVVPCA